MPIDTLAVARKLEAAGTPRAQAEALAEVLREAEREFWAELATKADLALLRQEMRQEIAALRADIAQLRSELSALEERVDGKLARLEQRMESELARLEQRMTIRLGAMLAAAVAIVAGLVRLL
ncbi:MAG: CCDC90 family protein [Geminicoccaceae bacterium]|nr:CCDC90 family protein [Geminicoccaceae bacterium]MCS7267712.1 CCDC90 family protein [Geminicoccaceae bacterium]MCX7629363.1 CCDC90 family protein [Geminicoccaceae bacterium]MDW8123555.1 DUF1640 domain-containing protein [Geminicoccaceae bacterium]MDW8339896.1 DUF1640 domain-containing protein [Geminicoccaceae bacterium]